MPTEMNYTSVYLAGLRHSRAWVQIAAAMLSGNSIRQTVHTHRASVHQAEKLVAALLRVAWVTAGLAESNGSLPSGFMTHVTCRLTAKNRDQLWNPALGNRVWATFTFFILPTRQCAVKSWNGAQLVYYTNQNWTFRQQQPYYCHYASQTALAGTNN